MPDPGREVTPLADRPADTASAAAVTGPPAGSETPEALFARLGTSAAGLTSDEARRRLEREGPNQPPSARRGSLPIRFLASFANPLALILLVAAIVTGLLGDRANAAIIIVMVVLSAVLSFWQTVRSQNAADRLRAGVSPTATALRDGAESEIPRRELVPGDVIRLAAGDLVPADARLIESRDLHVNQAALTGESLPVEKETADPDPDRHAVFLGTSVVSGTARAVVTATGGRTRFGDIAARLSARPPETEFERGTRRFGLFIMQTVFFLVLFVVVIAVAFHRNSLESLLFAVALAVGLTPEFLPMITTVTLGAGAIRMSRRKVIVRNLEAIQNFGSMDVLCSDKTGTITSGVMTLDHHVGPTGEASPRAFLLGYLNSLYETGVKDPTDAAVLHRGGANPLDVAILEHEHPDVARYRKIDEIPFDFERRRISVVVGTGSRRMLITKGAPEGILPLCSAWHSGRSSHPFEAADRDRVGAMHRDLSGQGFRVLAVASRTVPVQPAYGVADETGLTFEGYLAFVDAPLPDAGPMIAAMRQDGVAVKIITGDNEAVARHVCGQVGLDADRIVLGGELDSMSDPALAQVAERTDVFARVSPAQKNRIILALKRRGHVVGYMGDGINDAPSLHAADVGISVATAVDVARDAADIILMERGLKVLHDGIIEGRKAFGNVMKYLLMGTSSNFGNMFSMAGAFLFLPFLPMLPVQILLNNFLYDLSQVAIPTDNVDDTYIRKPKKWNIAFLRRYMIAIGPLSSIFDFLTFYVMLRVFGAGEALFHTGWFVESLATQTLVLFIIRTQGNPLRSRPSRLLTVSVLGIVAAAVALPFTSVGGWLGFVPLPAPYFAFLGVAVLLYLGLVEAVKRVMAAKLAA